MTAAYFKSLYSCKVAEAIAQIARGSYKEQVWNVKGR